MSIACASPNLRLGSYYYVLLTKNTAMLQVKLTAIGDTVGIVWPKEVLEKMNADKGDSLCFLESSEGFILTAHRRDFDEQMHAAEKVLNKYRNACRELAK